MAAFSGFLFLQVSGPLSLIILAWLGNSSSGRAIVNKVNFIVFDGVVGFDCDQTEKQVNSGTPGSWCNACCTMAADILPVVFPHSTSDDVDILPPKRHPADLPGKNRIFSPLLDAKQVLG
jgi:hypothetical protein